jgi:flagellar FliL protein
MTATALREEKATGKGAKGKDAAGKGDAGKDGKKSLFKSKKFIIGVVALAGVGGGVYKVMQPTPVVPPAAGAYITLDPTTVNLVGGHYLKIGVTIVAVAGKATLANFETAEAAQLVITEFSNRTVASLSSNAAREERRAHLIRALRKAYPDSSCTAAELKSTVPATELKCTKVWDAAITTFVMQ